MTFNFDETFPILPGAYDFYDDYGVFSKLQFFFIQSEFVILGLLLPIHTTSEGS